VIIADKKLKGNIFLAPMAGYTDIAFRTVCFRFGAALAFTEMVSCEALVRGSRKTFDLLARGEEEGPLGFQLFGSDALTISRAVRIVSSHSPFIIDLNCGCSVPKVLKTGSGAALLKDPEKLYRIVLSMKESTSLPISIKIRSGWDANSINFIEIGKAAEEAGASMVTLHPRTRAQGFSGKAEWKHIAQLKKALKVPVTGSGDLFTTEDIKRILDFTGCDAVMLARGAIGNPFIFAGRLPGCREKLLTAMEQLKIAIRYKGEKRACKDMRKHIAAYSKGLPDSSRLRNNLIRASSYGEYQKIISEYLSAHCSKTT